VSYNLYKYVDADGKILYVGKTTQLLSQRINQHNFEQAKYLAKTDHIEYVEVKNEADLSLYEIYYINLYMPQYNISQKLDQPTIVMPELQWHRYIKNQEVPQINNISKTNKPEKKARCVKSADEIAIISHKQRITYLTNRIVKEKESIQSILEILHYIEAMNDITVGSKPQLNKYVIYSYKYIPNKKYELNRNYDLIEFTFNQRYLCNVDNMLIEMSKIPIEHVTPRCGSEFTHFANCCINDTRASILFQSGEIPKARDVLCKKQNELLVHVSMLEKELNGGYTIA